MDWTQADIDALKAKISAGLAAQSTSFEGRTSSKTYRDLEDQLQLLEVMEREVNGTTRTRYSLASFYKD